MAQKRISMDEKFSGPRAAGPRGRAMELASKDQHALVGAQVDNLLNGKQRDAANEVWKRVQLDKLERDRAEADARLEYQKGVGEAKTRQTEGDLAEIRRQKGAQADAVTSENAAKVAFDRQNEMRRTEHQFGMDEKQQDARNTALSEQRRAAYKIAEMEKLGQIQQGANESQRDYELRATREAAKTHRQEQGVALITQGDQPADGVKQYVESGDPTSLRTGRAGRERKPIDDLGAAMRVGAMDADLMGDKGGETTSNGELFLSRLKEYREANPDYDPNDSRLIRAAMDDAGIPNTKIVEADAMYTSAKAAGMTPSQLIETAMDKNPLSTFDEIVQALEDANAIFQNHEGASAPGKPAPTGTRRTRPNVKPRI